MPAFFYFLTAYPLLSPRLYLGERFLPTQSSLCLCEKKAKEYALITADGESIHTLEELIDITPSFQVPILNPRGRIPIGRHLTEGEIEDIRELLTMNVLSFVRKYKDHERIVRV